ncbi:peptidylprolyl isomerase [Geopsychrobacter electrodiphilus]|uniref:peptidylprolyl isomerase n=1 Tax=Geopsychrobacter electrodiphilus TaxID=225196 RepID=UPI000365B6BF|nr:peptidyl-prolyl cis-trans isomerase [Geopsychrobacter electrodiphilus]
MLKLKRLGLGLLVLGLGLCACQQEQKPLIRIDQHLVTLNAFRQEIQPLQKELALLPQEQQKLLLRQALSQLIDQELLMAEAQQRGIEVSEQELQQEIAALRGNYTAAEYQDILLSSGQKPEHWKHQLRIRLLGVKVAARITEAKIHISPTQIEEFYLQHRADYSRPEQVRARQILLTTTEEAINLRSRLIAGETFATLAKQHSLSPERVNGGDLGLFSRGQFPPEVDAELFNLKPGHISDPIKSPYGVHLFQVEQRFAARVLPLSEVEGSILATLKAREETRLYQEWLHARRERSDVRIDWEQLDKLHFDRAE